MTDTNTQNIDTQPTNADPAVNRDQGKEQKMFTQDEVNTIVSERLKRDREKRTETNTENEREKALAERENRLSCREYITEKNYNAELLNILDTTDVEKFKAAADKIHEIYGFAHEEAKNRPHFSAPKIRNNPPAVDPIRNAFLSK